MTQSKLLTAVIPAILFFPGFALADTSNFGRDRNVSVADRMPDEYRPLGLRLGAFMLAPKLELGVASNDNVLYRPTDTVSDTLISAMPSATLTSNWSRHALSASASVDSESYSKYSDQNTTQWTVGAAGRLDIQRNSNLFANASYGQRYEALYD
ncbi:outer membrane beta-barrel protein, partial [Asticcacaulis sp. AC466]|uniref:outer membrane beta-barrel protein n=1 Tax=Asticcacaulis sp. AC466 TaxID=1282362 RepID=UPI0004CE3961